MTPYQEAVEELVVRFTNMGGAMPSLMKRNALDTFGAYFSIKRYEIEATEIEIDGFLLSSFSMPESRSFELGAIVSKCSETFELAKLIIKSNIGSGTPIPKGLLPFAFELIDGTARRPASAHRQADNHFFLNMMIFQLINTAIIEHGMTFTRNDTSPQISACDAVSDALQRVGIQFSYSKVKELCVSPRKRSERNAVKLFLYSEHREDALFLGKNFGQNFDKQLFADVMRK